MSYWSDKRVVVTGGGGFLGTHVVEALRSRRLPARLRGAEPGVRPDARGRSRPLVRRSARRSRRMARRHARGGRGHPSGRAGGRHPGEQGQAGRFLLREPDDGRADHAPRLEAGSAEVRGGRRRLRLSAARADAAQGDELLGRLPAAGERTVLAGQAHAAHPVDRVLATAPLPGDRGAARQHLRPARQLRPGERARGPGAGAQVRRGDREPASQGRGRLGDRARQPRFRLRGRRRAGHPARRRELRAAGAREPVDGTQHQRARGGGAALGASRTSKARSCGTPRVPRASTTAAWTRARRAASWASALPPTCARGWRSQPAGTARTRAALAHSRCRGWRSRRMRRAPLRVHHHRAHGLSSGSAPAGSRCDRRARDRRDGAPASTDGTRCRQKGT